MNSSKKIGVTEMSRANLMRIIKANSHSKQAMMGNQEPYEPTAFNDL